MKQSIYEASAVQIYPLGKRLAIDSRVFRYTRAGGALICGLGAFNAVTQHVSFAAVTVNLDAPGTKTLVVPVGAGDGVAANGNIAEDEMVGGYIIVFPDGMADTFNRRIVHNTAVTGGGAMTMTLDGAIPVALSPNPHAELMASPYFNVQDGNRGSQPVMGIPPIAATIGQYFWLQTWGPVWIAPQANVSVGALNDRVYFREDGSITSNDPGGAYANAQLAGFVLTSAPGGGQGAPFVQLMIAP